MNEKTKTNAATGSLYRVNYQYVAKNGALRAGALVIEAKDTQDAWNKAEEKLPSFGLSHTKITNAKPY